MTDRDSAFLWETEALRTGPPRRRAAPGGSVLEAGDWVTLREATELTGVPTETIRKWARRERIPSFLETTEDGHLRIVSLEGIRDWSQKIGRDLEPIEDDGEDLVVDLSPDQRSEPVAEVSPIPEGSMLVPLDAWNKMLNQLGNLHEAGQQLAEARERAAKAETEALFLKERLAEMRSELERARGVGDEGPPATQEEGRSQAGVSTTLGGAAASLARRLYDGWRGRRRV